MMPKARLANGDRQPDEVDFRDRAANILKKRRSRNMRMSLLDGTRAHKFKKTAKTNIVAYHRDPHKRANRRILPGLMAFGGTHSANHH